MTDQTTPTASHNLVVRKIPFDFNENIAPVWHKNMHEWSHMVNGTSLTMPYLEPFLIRTMREAMEHISDPALLDDIRGFNAQEGQHFQNHRAYNERLKANGYPELAKLEDDMEEEYKYLQSKSLRWRVAFAAGFETMTMGATVWLITKRRKLFTGADPSVTSFVLWHMVEETEHKNVAFDVYQALYGSYLPRLWGVWCGSYMVLKYSKRAYMMMLAKDGKKNDWRSRLRLMKLETAFLFSVGKFLLGSLLPGHHPDHVRDPDWVKQWGNAYSRLAENTIPLLDTSDPDIPARFSTK